MKRCFWWYLGQGIQLRQVETGNLMISLFLESKYVQHTLYFLVASLLNLYSVFKKRKQILK